MLAPDVPGSGEGVGESGQPPGSPDGADHEPLALLHGPCGQLGRASRQTTGLALEELRAWWRGKMLCIHLCRTGDATGMAAPGGLTPQTLEGTEAEKSREPDWPLLQAPGPRGGPGPRAWVRKAICRAPRTRGLQDMTGESPPGSRHNTRKKTSPSRNKGQNVIQPSTLC